MEDFSSVECFYIQITFFATLLSHGYSFLHHLTAAHIELPTGKPLVCVCVYVCRCNTVGVCVV